jgi:hypothetical protein
MWLGREDLAAIELISTHHGREYLEVARKKAGPLGPAWRKR